MADIVIKNTTADSSRLSIARHEPLSKAYGKIPAAAYTLDDTLVFSGIPSREIIYAKFVTASAEVEVMPKADLSSPIVLELKTKEDISYVVEYVRGPGRVPGSTYKTEGVVLKLTVAEEEE